MKYSKNMDGQLLAAYFGFHLMALMVTYLLFDLSWRTLSINSFLAFIFLLSMFSFLLVCSVHEMGHYVALKLRKYRVSSFSVLLYFLPYAVHHPEDPIKPQDATLLCLSGPFAGVFISLILGVLLWLTVPISLPVVILLVISASGLGWKDYKNLKNIQRSTQTFP